MSIRLSCQRGAIDAGHDKESQFSIVWVWQTLWLRHCICNANLLKALLDRFNHCMQFEISIGSKRLPMMR